MKFGTSAFVGPLPLLGGRGRRLSAPAPQGEGEEVSPPVEQSCMKAYVVARWHPEIVGDDR